MNRLGVAVLAGGKSSRMGEEKMNLYYNNQTFLENILTKLKENQEIKEILVGLNNNQHYEDQQVKIVKDIYQEIGPIGGIYSALERTTCDNLWVWACDMPKLSKEFIEYIISCIEGNYDAYIIRNTEGKISPMGSIYNKQVKAILERQIQNKNYKLMDFIARLNVKYIDLKYTVFNDGKVLTNINTPLEYKKLVRKNVIAISGTKNSGKTTILCNLIKHFNKRGLKVGTIKHDGHTFKADVPGTDSYEHKKSGAVAAIVFDKDKYSLVKDMGQETIEYWIENIYQDMDIIFLEGFKHSNYPKIEIIRAETENGPVCDIRTVIAYATNDQKFRTQKNDIPVYGLEDIQALGEAIEKYIMGKKN